MYVYVIYECVYPHRIVPLLYTHIVVCCGCIGSGQWLRVCAGRQHAGGAGGAAVSYMAPATRALWRHEGRGLQRHRNTR